MNLSKKSKLCKYKCLLFLLLPLFIPQIVNADNSQAEASTTAEVLPVMPTIHVEAVRITSTTGMTIIDKEIIENLPIRNGSVNEIIGIVPGVQYSEGSTSSFTGGEITPPVVSISGSRFYDNNYTIDGISNNNPLDPIFNRFKDASKLPSHPQIHFLNPEIIEQITVYDSNIPAKFGGFTGGQIDTQTINPTPNFWGKVHYRTTSDSWTKFHIDPIDQDDFNNSNDSDMQPTFKKHDFGLTLNTPLGFDTSLVTSYQQLYSKIPLQYLDGNKTQTRKYEVFLAKISHYLTNDFNISLTSLYSPTSSHYFSPEYKESEYTIDSINFSLAGRAEAEFNAGQVNLTLGYTKQETSRDALGNRFRWDPDTDSIGWLSGKEGGFGILETGQDQLNIKVDILFNLIKWHQTDHIFQLGGGITHSSQYYHRPETNYYYYGPIVNTLTICTPNDSSCIEGEQYFSKRTKYKQADVETTATDIAVFFQDSIIWKRLEVIPGIRISHDDITDNVNIAPRFAVSLDVFGNQSTTLFAGKNRYFSGTLLTHDLYQGIQITNQIRDEYNDDWSDKSVTFLFDNGEVKTPYTDEITLGLIQKFLGGQLKVQYIEKKSKDEFARSSEAHNPDPDIYTLNNFGRSEHESIQLKWHKSWKKHFLEINSTWQKTTTSHDDYFEKLDEDNIAETIWYEGEELYYYETPRKDFNRPVIANLIYTGKFPYNITFTNTTKYRGAYWRHWLARDSDNKLIKKPSIINPEQPDPYVYEKVKSHSSVIFDWQFSWRIPKSSRQNIVLSLDVFNVFNRRAKIGYQSGNYGYNYELGRQIWAGLEFNF